MNLRRTVRCLYLTSLFLEPSTLSQERPTHWLQIDNHVSHQIEFLQALHFCVNTFAQGMVSGTLQEVSRSALNVQTVLDIVARLGLGSEGGKQQLAQQRLADGALVFQSFSRASGRNRAGAMLLRN
ncbi:hypothetical protein EBU99_06435 [bacterium]|nr:hypothetical protein [bacterium]